MKRRHVPTRRAEKPSPELIKALVDFTAATFLVHPLRIVDGRGCKERDVVAARHCAAVALADAGFMATAIAEALDIDRTTVTYALRRNPDPELRQKALALVEAHLG